MRLLYLLQDVHYFLHVWCVCGCRHTSTLWSTCHTHRWCCGLYRVVFASAELAWECTIDFYVVSILQITYCSKLDNGRDSIGVLIWGVQVRCQLKSFLVCVNPVELKLIFQALTGWYVYTCMYHMIYQLCFLPLGHDTLVTHTCI